MRPKSSEELAADAERTRAVQQLRFKCLELVFTKIPNQSADAIEALAERFTSFVLNGNIPLDQRTTGEPRPATSGKTEEKRAP